MDARSVMLAECFVYFAWGYGGHFVFVVPSAAMVVVATSNPTPERRDGSHLDMVHGLVNEPLAPAGAPR